MSGLISKIEETPGSGIFVAMGARKTNSVGTPLVSATANSSGEDLPDIYSLAFTSVIASTSATVTVSAASGRNPYNGRTKSVLLDGTTIYKDVIGGVDLVFSSSGSFIALWTAEVRVGKSFGSFNAFPPDAGTASDSVRIQVENTGGDTAVNCKARILPNAKRYRKTGITFFRVRPFAEDAVEKLTGEKVVPYVVAASNVTGSGASKTMDVRIDSLAQDVVNLTTLVEGTSDALNVVDFYRITSGDLTDVEFMLNEDAVNSDTENLLVFEHRFSQIAPDLNGTPGAFATVDVDLTEDGQETGIITAGGLAYFWLRVLVPENGNSSSNPYQISICVEGSANSMAGFTD